MISYTVYMIMIGNNSFTNYLAVIDSSLRITYLSDGQSVEELKPFLTKVLSGKVPQFINKPPLMSISKNIVEKIRCFRHIAILMKCRLWKNYIKLLW